MSYMSDSNSSCSSTSSNKRRISQIDDNIEQLTQEVNSLNDFVYRTELECSLMTVRVKREKLKALEAIAKSQVLMANMQVLVAEGELYTDIERLKTIKKRRLGSESGASIKHLHQAPPPSTSTVAVQTTKSTPEKKKKQRRHSSTKKTPIKNTSIRKSPINISSDETVIIPSLYESTTSLVENSQTSLTSFSQIFDKTLASRSGSDISLSSSVKAEFNDPFTQSQAKEIVQKTPAKKNKSDKKETKSRSKSHSQKANSVAKHTQSPKTVADLRKTVHISSKHTDSISRTVRSPKCRQDDKKPPPSASYVPARHSNLPQLVLQPSTSATSPLIYVNPATQTNIKFISQPEDATPYRLLPFCSGKE